jgi:phosphoribosylpyrophosphate synthetase
MGDFTFDDLMRAVAEMSPEESQTFFGALENKRLREAEGFITPELHASLRTDMQTSRRRLTFAHTPSGRYFARQTMDAYNAQLDEAGSDSSNHVGLLSIKHIEFGEGEVNPRIENPVDGNDIFLFTSAFDPGAVHEGVMEHVAVLKRQGILDERTTLDDLLVDSTNGEVPSAYEQMVRSIISRDLNNNLMTTYLYIRTLKENNAGHITVVMPYFAYGRQNRPTSYMREGTHARTACDLLFTGAGADGLMTYDPHAPDLHGFLPAGITKKLIDPFSQNCRIFEEYRHRPNVAFAYLDEGCKKRYGKLVEWLGPPID